MQGWSQLARLAGLSLIVGLAPAPAWAQTAEMLAAATAGSPASPEFEALLARLPEVRLRDPFGLERRYYAIEGDVLATRNQVWAWALETSRAPTAGVAGTELIVMSDGGRKIFWPPERRRLTYVVERASFRSDAEADLVAVNFEAAAKEWERLCTGCGLSITRLDAVGAPSPDQPDPFRVVFLPDVADLIAAAFFPNDPPEKHLVVVAPSYFTTTFDRIGVFRHEIGHILGYRHTHILGVPGCRTEGGEFLPLTPDGGRDRLSVMHYFCGGGGTRELSISPTDRIGHQALYGP